MSEAEGKPWPQKGFDGFQSRSCFHLDSSLTLTPVRLCLDSILASPGIGFDSSLDCSLSWIFQQYSDPNIHIRPQMIQ